MNKRLIIVKLLGTAVRLRGGDGRIASGNPAGRAGADGDAVGAAESNETDVGG